jgi:capsular exopolysaccharide synthesis family protein
MPRSPVAEAYRVTRTNIDFATLDKPSKVMLITSARDGEGKTTTSMNLAATFAMSGRRILLVDVDLRRAGLTRKFTLRSKPGLSSALMQSADEDVSYGTDIDTLRVVPSGPFPPNPAELLGSLRMREWVKEMSKQYDLIVLDAPPILSLADTRMLAPLADNVLMVVDPSLSTRRLVRQARLALDAVGARILGIVVNKGLFHSDQHYYYNYYYYYSAYTAADQNGHAGGAEEEVVHELAESGREAGSRS